MSRKLTPSERLDRIVRGLAKEEFKLLDLGVERGAGKDEYVVQILLRRTPKRLEPGSGKRTPKRPHNNGVRELIFDDEEDGGRGC